MSEHTDSLDKEGWSKHYNIDSQNYVVKCIQTGSVQVWAEELCNIIANNTSKMTGYVANCMANWFLTRLSNLFIFALYKY